MVLILRETTVGFNTYWVVGKFKPTLATIETVDLEKLRKIYQEADNDFETTNFIINEFGEVKCKLSVGKDYIKTPEVDNKKISFDAKIELSRDCIWVILSYFFERECRLKINSNIEDIKIIDRDDLTETVIINDYNFSKLQNNIITLVMDRDLIGYVTKEFGDCNFIKVMKDTGEILLDLKKLYFYSEFKGDNSIVVKLIRGYLEKRSTNILEDVHFKLLGFSLGYHHMTNRLSELNSEELFIKDIIENFDRTGDIKQYVRDNSKELSQINLDSVLRGIDDFELYTEYPFDDDLEDIAYYKFMSIEYISLKLINYSFKRRIYE